MTSRSLLSLSILLAVGVSSEALAVPESCKRPLKRWNDAVATGNVKLVQKVRAKVSLAAGSCKELADAIEDYRPPPSPSPSPPPPPPPPSPPPSPPPGTGNDRPIISKQPRAIAIPPIVVNPKEPEPLPTDFDFNKALTHLNNKQYDLAINAFKKIAENSQDKIRSDSEFYIAKLYAPYDYTQKSNPRYYPNSPIDEKESLYWLMRAAEHEQPYAQYTLGMLYLSAQNKTEAIKFFRISADKVPESEAKLFELEN